MKRGAFDGDREKGLIMLPVELIDDNGIRLKECVLRQADNWHLEDGFLDWVEEACIFTSTLVDRIVTGYPADDPRWRTNPLDAPKNPEVQQ